MYELLLIFFPLIIVYKMELQYRTTRDVNIDKQLNRLDKVTSKLALTLKDIPGTDTLSQHLKDKIVSLITRDEVRQLLRCLERQVVSCRRQVGVKNSQWNLLHVCAKFNANKCAKALLMQLYQLQGQEEYLQCVNSQTTEGFTPLMISIIYQGDRVLQLLLQLGGVDLSIIQRGKLRAYDLALHYRNQYAISQLIVYEDKIRNKQFLNEEELIQPHPLLQQKPSVFESMTSCLLDCFICFNFQDDPVSLASGRTEKMFSKKDCDYDIVDIVKVGSRKDIQDYEIEWRPLSKVAGQKGALFDTFKPQDITQSQFCLKNSLIINQALSDFPWLLRKVITKEDTLPGSPQKYLVHLYHNGILKKVVVDECIPIIKELGQPMFLSNRTQIWPMILQKSLAKTYGSYLSLSALSTNEMLQTITGFYVKEIPLVDLTENGVVGVLQDFMLRGYMVLLKGRPRTQLNTGSERFSYAVLNCYQKGMTRKVLISCPNLVQNWQEPKDIRQLAILKAHFSRHNQSCLWIDESKLQYYFTHATVVFLKEGYIRSDLKMKVKIKAEGDLSCKQVNEGNKPSQYRKAVFFKFKVEKRGEDPILLQIQDQETKQKFDLATLQGWRNEGSEALIREQEHYMIPEIAKVTCAPGQYLCKFQLTANRSFSKSFAQPSKGIMKKKQASQEECSNSFESRKKVQLNLGPEHLRLLQLTVWAPHAFHLQLLQEQFGTIEWLEHYRSYIDTNWNRLCAQGQIFFAQKVNNKTIVVVRRIGRAKRYIELDCDEQEVIQGNWQSKDGIIRVQLVNEGEGQCLYCVVANIGVNAIKQAKIINQ